jgi:hypothetical protein
MIQKYWPFLLLIFITSCKRTVKYECIGFNANESRWVNYALNQETYFKKSEDTTFPFIVKKLVISQLEISPNKNGEFKSKFISTGKPKSCEMYYEAKSIVDTFNISATSNDIIKEASGDNVNLVRPNTISINIRWKDFSHYLTLSNDVPKEKTDTDYGIKTVKRFTNKKIGNYVYSDLVEIADDTTIQPNKKMWKVLYAKDYGVIGYTTRFPFEEWVRY